MSNCKTKGFWAFLITDKQLSQVLYVSVAVNMRICLSRGVFLSRYLRSSKLLGFSAIESHSSTTKCLTLINIYLHSRYESNFQKPGASVSPKLLQWYEEFRDLWAIICPHTKATLRNSMISLQVFGWTQNLDFWKLGRFGELVLLWGLQRCNFEEENLHFLGVWANSVWIE